MAVNDARKIYRTQFTELQATIEAETYARIVTVHSTEHCELKCLLIIDDRLNVRHRSGN